MSSDGIVLSLSVKELATLKFVLEEKLGQKAVITTCQYPALDRDGGNWILVAVAVQQIGYCQNGDQGRIGIQFFLFASAR